MITYQALTETSLDTLHAAFTAAFSDYQVKLDLPFWKFTRMLKRRGYDATLSIGAFQDGQLIGFVLNGVRDWQGKPTAYDLGTGVIATYRQQGLTSKMLAELQTVLHARQVGQYLLEVITTNTAAVALYQKQGFSVQRHFACYRMDKTAYVPQTNCPVEALPVLPVEDLTALGDFPPSWQNAAASISAVQEVFHYAVVKRDGRIIGYGVIDRETGDIPQLAVQTEYRRQGVGRSILTELVNHTTAESISILNVDEQALTLRAFLQTAGFTCFVSQYEMLRHL